MVHDTRRRMQKLVSFEDSKRGYTQLAKELENSWAIVSIAQHDAKKYICVLEKLDKDIMGSDRSIGDLLQYLLSGPLPSKKRRLLGDV